MFKFYDNGKLIYVSETKKADNLIYDKVVEDANDSVENYGYYNGALAETSSDVAISAKKAEIRETRDRFLAETDKFLIQDYPITSSQKAKYKQYRAYLRDYPDSSEDWFEHEPMSFTEWTTSQTTA